MLLARCLTTITISCCLISCGAGKQLPAPAWYQHPSPIDTGLLSFDGYYTIDNDPRYPLDRNHALTPVFNTAKNNIWISHGAYTLTDSSLFTCKYANKKDFGKYRTEGNKITAFLPVVVELGEASCLSAASAHRMPSPAVRFVTSLKIDNLIVVFTGIVIDEPVHRFGRKLVIIVPGYFITGM